MSEFFQAVGRYKTVVLNGDIFDFKRSTLPSATETTAQAIRWLQDLCARFPDTSFYYLLGNHDSHREFVEAVSASASNQPNLTIIHDSILIGSALFLHGDVIDLPEGSHDLIALRRKYADARPNISSKAFATLVTFTRLNFVEHLRHRKKTLARKIVGYLRAAQPAQLAEAKDIFFGHTHVPFRRFTYDGLTFHNTGSLVRGLPWMPMEFDIS
jgi:UDP-2,3-diacylglucosamine hydrolase